MHIIVTGGTGYIGRRVVQTAVRHGHRVTLLGVDRAFGGAAHAFPWRLHDEIPREVWTDPADAIVHLAHIWHAEGPEADDPNLRGMAALLAAARQAHVRRFVFASSISSRDGALNRYGRIKHRCEGLLSNGEIAARIGLVYGGPSKSLWGTLRTLTGSFPVLPIIGRRQPVQPIHLDDLAEGLVRLATMPAAMPRCVVLAADTPISFGDFLQEIASLVHGRRLLLLLPLPTKLLLVLLDAAVAFGLLAGVRERVLGLLGIAVQPSASDLERLGLSLRPLDAGLRAEATGRGRRRVAEAFAFLRYVLGRPPSPASIRRFVRGWRRYDWGDPLLPRAVCKHPWLLRFVEPFPGDRRKKSVGVRARLHAAVLVAETDAGAGARFYSYDPGSRARTGLRMFAKAMAEGLLLLPRSLFGYWVWR